MNGRCHWGSCFARRIDHNQLAPKQQQQQTFLNLIPPARMANSANSQFHTFCMQLTQFIAPNRQRRFTKYFLFVFIYHETFNAMPTKFILYIFFHIWKSKNIPKKKMLTYCSQKLYSNKVDRPKQSGGNKEYKKYGQFYRYENYK